jgi:ATP-binding cassette subfamily B multidrug efflux pump
MAATSRGAGGRPAGGATTGPRRGPGMMGRHGGLERPKNARGAMVRLAAYLRPHLAKLSVVLVLEVLNSAMAVLGPYLMGLAIDALVMPGGAERLPRVMTIMAGSYAGAWVTQLGQHWIMAGVAQTALKAMRRDLFCHLQTLTLRYFDQHPHGELMSRLTNDIDAISRVLSQSVTQLITSVLTLASILVVMFTRNLWLTLVTLTVIPLMFLVTMVIARRVRERFRALQAQLGDLNGQMEETVSGAKEVQAFHQQEAAVAAFARLNNQVRNTGIHAQTLGMAVMPIMNLLSNLNLALIAGAGGWLALQGMATVGTIASFIQYGRRFGMPLRQISETYNNIQSALAGAERVFQVIDEVPDLEDAPNARPLDDIQGEVVFDDVCFGYDPDVPVLKNVSLHARPGETVALVGPTGAGKTTIVNLLSRFYDVNQGAIRIDGHDVREVQKDTLRRQLGVVLQDTFLFSESVMDNIRYGRLDATDEEVIAAARLANADQFIRRLPEGYDTELSERASNISQGQRQLLAIARAALADPRILVLDEATSSVDTRTEAQIQEALLKLMEGRTSFVIAHRLSTIRNADQVLVINHGEIIERGSHESLLAQRGFYYNLYMSQFKGQATEPLPVGMPGGGPIAEPAAGPAE